MKSKKTYEGFEELFDGLLNKIVEMVKKDDANEEVRDLMSKNSVKSYGHDADLIMESLIFHFLRFYLLLQHLPDSQDELRRFIEFPNSTQIEAVQPMTEEEIVSETLAAAIEAFEYFDETSDELFTSNMFLFLDETRARTLFKRAGKFYKFDKYESFVFSYKGQIMMRLMKARVKVTDNRGRKSSWTPELRKDFLEFYEDCLEILNDAGAKLNKFKNTNYPYKHLKLEYPQIPDEIMELFFVSRKVANADKAISWAAEHFGIETTMTTIKKKVLPVARLERTTQREAQGTI